MRSIKAYMPVLLLGLLTLLVGTATAQNGQQLFQQSKSVSPLAGPCSSGSITVTGTTHVVYQQNGTHYVIHYNFDGTGTDTSNNNSYSASLAGTAQNPEVFLGTAPTAVIYQFQYQGTFTSQGSAPSFNMSGVILVLVKDGVPIDDKIISGTTSCQN